MAKLKKRILVFKEDGNGKQEVRKVEIFEDAPPKYGKPEMTGKELADLKRMASKGSE